MVDSWELGMELRDIETFLTVAEKLHFGRAARRLYLSPSRVSQTIRNLEREIGGLLFVRTTRQVRLTPLGEQFRVRAEYGLGILRTALRDAQASARGVETHIGSTERASFPVPPVGQFACIDEAFLGEAASAFQASQPGSRAHGGSTGGSNVA
jgi:DNA-binding transcriptional LysR family regulator